MVKPHSVLRSLAGTTVAVLGGWAAGVLFVALIGVITYPADHRNNGTVIAALWNTPIAFAIFMWLFIVPVWLLALVPLYLLIPRSSVLWQRWLCTALGAVAGTLILLAVYTFGHFDVDELWIYCATATVVGGITCLIGSSTMHRFKRAI